MGKLDWMAHVTIKLKKGPAKSQKLIGELKNMGATKADVSELKKIMGILTVGVDGTWYWLSKIWLLAKAEEAENA